MEKFFELINAMHVDSEIPSHHSLVGGKMAFFNLLHTPSEDLEGQLEQTFGMEYIRRQGELMGLISTAFCILSYVKDYGMPEGFDALYKNSADALIAEVEVARTSLRESAMENGMDEATVAKIEEEMGINMEAVHNNFGPWVPFDNEQN